MPTPVQPEPLWSLCYLSTATGPLSAQELDALLATARKCNAENAVTGILLYTGDSFMQVLEGARCDVRRVYERIRRSPLHHGIVELFDEPIRERDFGDWAMVLRQVDAGVLGRVQAMRDVLRRDLLLQFCASAR